MARGLEQASSSAEVDGSITGYTPPGWKNVTYISVPIKLSPGRETVDLATGKTAIRLITPYGAYEDINKGVYVWNLGSTLINPLNSSDTKTITGSFSIENIAAALWPTKPSNPEAYVIFVRNVTSDTVLEFGEKAIIIINIPDGLKPYDTFNIELRPPEGAPLTVERMIPPTLPANGGTVDLG